MFSFLIPSAFFLLSSGFFFSFLPSFFSFSLPLSFPLFLSFPASFLPPFFLLDGSCPRTDTDLEDTASDKEDKQEEDILDMNVLDAVSDNDNSKEDLDWTNLLCLDTAADRSV